MKRLFEGIFLMMIVVSCAGEATTDTANDESSSEDIARLKSENRALQDQLSEKDSALNESIQLFNEIEQNLAMINLKEDEIRLRSNNVELEEDGKQWILQEIQNINYLREENAKKVNELNGALENKNLEIAQLKILVETLMNKITVQEEEIELLRVELMDLDREYVELLEAYQEQTQITVETIKELNKAFYAYGTVDELLEAGVLVKEGGFIGMGKKAHLKDNFNEEYFTQVDLSTTKFIDVTGSKIRLITDHPSTSYTITTEGNKNRININDEKSFWRVSKYFVAVVE